VVATATASGSVNVHVLAGGAMPRWAESPPQCIAEDDGGSDGGLRAVRSQASSSQVAAPADLLLMDVIKLGLPGGDEDEEEALASSGRTVALLRDPAVQDTLYCVHSSAAHAVILTWLPAVSAHVTEAEAAEAKGEPLPSLPRLPRPAVERLQLGGPGVVDATAVGDPLCGSALVILHANGAHSCQRPASSVDAISSNGSAAPRSTSPPADIAVGQVQLQIDRIYGEVLRGLEAVQLPAVESSAGAGDPAGQRLLQQSIAALRGGHVEFAHQAHHDLLEVGFLSFLFFFFPA
jgi:hypothetical protein